MSAATVPVWATWPEWARHIHADVIVEFAVAHEVGRAEAEGRQADEVALRAKVMIWIYNKHFSAKPLPPADADERRWEALWGLFVEAADGYLAHGRGSFKPGPDLVGWPLAGASAEAANTLLTQRAERAAHVRSCACCLARWDEERPADGDTY